MFQMWKLAPCAQIADFSDVALWSWLFSLEYKVDTYEALGYLGAFYVLVFNCKSTLCTAQSMCNQKEVFFFPSLAVLFPGNFQISECLFTLT